MGVCVFSFLLNFLFSIRMQFSSNWNVTTKSIQQQQNNQSITKYKKILKIQYNVIQQWLSFRISLCASVCVRVCICVCVQANLNHLSAFDRDGAWCLTEICDFFKNKINKSINLYKSAITVWSKEIYKYWKIFLRKIKSVNKNEFNTTSKAVQK